MGQNIGMAGSFNLSWANLARAPDTVHPSPSITCRGPSRRALPAAWRDRSAAAYPGLTSANIASRRPSAASSAAAAAAAASFSASLAFSARRAVRGFGAKEPSSTCCRPPARPAQST